MKQNLKPVNIAKRCTGENIMMASSKKIKADTMNGYTRIANEMLDHLCRLKITARQMRVFMAIVRKTYGFNKKSDRLAASQIAQIMGYPSDVKNIAKDVRALKSLSVIICYGGCFIGPNPELSNWGNISESTCTSPCEFDNNYDTGNQECSINSQSEGVENDPQQASDGLQQGVENDSKRGLKMTPTKDNTKDNNNIIVYRRKIQVLDFEPNRVKPEFLPTSKIPTKKARKKSSLTEVPESMLVTDAMRTWAADKGIDLNLDYETEKFLNHHGAKGSKFKEWDRAWKNWMLKAKEFADRDRARYSNQPRRKTFEEEINDTSWFDEEMEDFFAEHARSQINGTFQ